MDRKITIIWERLVEDNRTCPRCSSTGEELEQAVALLKPVLSQAGVELSVEQRVLTLEEFKQNPLRSNRILINNRPLESWLAATTGQSLCCDVCGSAQCRTVELGSRTYEAVPTELIVQAVLNALQELRQQ